MSACSASSITRPEPTSYGKGQRRLEYLELMAAYSVAKQHERVGVVVVALRRTGSRYEGPRRGVRVWRAKYPFERGQTGAKGHRHGDQSSHATRNGFRDVQASDERRAGRCPSAR